MVAQLLAFVEQQGMAATKQLIERHCDSMLLSHARRQQQQQQQQQHEVQSEQELTQGQEQVVGSGTGQQGESSRLGLRTHQSKEDNQQRQQQEEEGEQLRVCQQMADVLRHPAGMKYVLTGFPPKPIEDRYKQCKSNARIQWDLAAIMLRLVCQACLALKMNSLLEQAQQKGAPLAEHSNTLKALLLAATVLYTAPCLVAMKWMRSQYWRVRKVTLALAALGAMLSAVLVLYVERSTHAHDASSHARQQMVSTVLLASQVFVPLLQQPTGKTLAFVALVAMLHAHFVCALSWPAEMALLLGSLAAEPFVVCT